MPSAILVPQQPEPYESTRCGCRGSPRHVEAGHQSPPGFRTFSALPEWYARCSEGVVACLVDDTATLSQLAVESSPTGVLIVDSHGTMTAVSRGIERQFGYSRDELIGRSVDVLLPAGLPSIPAPRGCVGCAEDARPTANPELYGRCKDGSSIPLQMSYSRLDAPAGVFVLVSVSDIPDCRFLDERQRQAHQEQVEFETLAARQSAKFINVPKDAIDDAIQSAMGQICEALDLDRSTLFTIDGDGVLFDAVSWERAGVPALRAAALTRERFPWIFGRVLAGELLAVSTHADVPNETDRASLREMGIRSTVVAPLAVDGQVVGAVGFTALRAERRWEPAVVLRLTLIAQVFGGALARKRRDEALRTALAEVDRLKEELRAENAQLRQETTKWLESPNVFGRSSSVRVVLEQVHQVARTDATVLLIGETGTGKELFASRIHELSTRRRRPLVRVNCAAIPATLIESELFGREKGAFTGALAKQVGRFELAEGSTIFLDEIGDLPLEVQVKLLRVIEQRTIERLGDPRPIPVDTRIIAATHRDLEQRIAAGSFREDLFYRLNVFPIAVPPLRDRVEDIPLLVWRFVEEFSRSFGKRIDTVASKSLIALQQYAWPGNVRELRNVVERAMITASGTELTIAPPVASAAAARRSGKLVDIQREHVRSVLERAGWRIRGVGGAAERLGVKATTLEGRLAKLGLKRRTHA
jgi:formate hydrogenlyase transcriptional activator